MNNKRIIEIATECTNPVVRNAILASTRRNDRAAVTAENFARRQRRTALREWSASINRQSAALNNGLRAGLGDNPAWLEVMEEMIKKTDQCKAQFCEADADLRAIREAANP